MLEKVNATRNYFIDFIDHLIVGRVTKSNKPDEWINKKYRWSGILFLKIFEEFSST